MPAVSCGMWDLLTAACELLVACGIRFPDEGLNLDPLHWKYRVLTTGPPGKFPDVSIISKLQFGFLLDKKVSSGIK